MNAEETPEPPRLAARLDLEHGFHQNIIHHLLQEARYFESEKPQEKSQKKITPINSNKKPARAMYTIPAKRNISECDSTMMVTSDLLCSDSETPQKAKSLEDIVDFGSDLTEQPSQSPESLLKAATEEPSSLSLCDIFNVGRNLVHSACTDAISQSRFVSIYSLIYKNEVKSTGDKGVKFRITLSMCAVMTTEYENLSFRLMLGFLQHILFATVAIKKESIVIQQITHAIVKIVGKILKLESGSANLIDDICCVLINTSRYLVKDCRDKFKKIIITMRERIPRETDATDARVLRHSLGVCEAWLEKRYRLACDTSHLRAA